MKLQFTKISQLFTEINKDTLLAYHLLNSQEKIYLIKMFENNFKYNDVENFLFEIFKTRTLEIVFIYPQETINKLKKLSKNIEPFVQLFIEQIVNNLTETPIYKIYTEIFQNNSNVIKGIIEYSNNTENHIKFYNLIKSQNQHLNEYQLNGVYIHHLIEENWDDRAITTARNVIKILKKYDLFSNIDENNFEHLEGLIITDIANETDDIKTKIHSEVNITPEIIEYINNQNGTEYNHDEPDGISYAYEWWCMKYCDFDNQQTSNEIPTFKVKKLTETELTLYHTSKVEINSLEDSAMFFALEKNHAIDGWHKANIDNDVNSYVYKCKFKGKICNIDENLKLFDDNNFDVDDYLNYILSNPEPDEINDNEVNKFLINLGFDGVIFSDYDPRDFQNDLDAIMVFDVNSTISDFELIEINE